MLEGYLATIPIMANCFIIEFKKTLKRVFIVGKIVDSCGYQLY